MHLTIVGSRRRLRLGRPLQHLFLARDGEGHAAGRLRRVGAAGAEGAQCSIPTASTRSCCRICMAIISAACRSSCSTRSFWRAASRPLLIAGPAGHARAARRGDGGVLSEIDRLEMAVSPGSVAGNRGRHCRRRARPSLVTAEVIHQSGAPSTALRLSDGDKTFAYSGDTEWTDALLADRATAPTCSSANATAYAGTKITGHLTWEILQPRLGDLGAQADHGDAHEPDHAGAARRGEGGRRADRGRRTGDGVLSEGLILPERCVEG